MPMGLSGCFLIILVALALGTCFVEQKPGGGIPGSDQRSISRMLPMSAAPAASSDRGRRVLWPGALRIRGGWQGEKKARQRRGHDGSSEEEESDGNDGFETMDMGRGELMSDYDVADVDLEQVDGDVAERFEGGIDEEEDTAFGSEIVGSSDTMRGLEDWKPWDVDGNQEGEDATGGWAAMGKDMDHARAKLGLDTGKEKNRKESNSWRMKRLRREEEEGRRQEQEQKKEGQLQARVDEGGGSVTSSGDHDKGRIDKKIGGGTGIEGVPASDDEGAVGEGAGGGENEEEGENEDEDHGEDEDLIARALESSAGVLSLDGQNEDADENSEDARVREELARLEADGHGEYDGDDDAEHVHHDVINGGGDVCESAAPNKVPCRCSMPRYLHFHSFVDTRHSSHAV